MRILGRSSSHFTRTVRVFAHELGVAYAFEPVLDLMSPRASDYGDNPALKLPVLETEHGAWFGALNICRELSRGSTRSLGIVWPEDLHRPLAANAQELVLQGMSSEVTLIMAEVSNPERRVPYQDPYKDKTRSGLVNTLDWLEQHVTEALTQLGSERAVSFLEVTLFCFVTHLDFRQVVNTDRYAQLRTFCKRFDERESARSTAYQFDSA